MKKILTLVYLIIIFFAPAVLADIYQYTDDNGSVHYVNRLTKVPDEYKNQLKNVLETDETSTSEVQRRPVYDQKNTKKKVVRKKKVEIFVTSWCGYCRKLESYLKQNNIKYKKYDVEKNSYGKKRYKQLGGGGIPITTIGDSVVRGYNPTAIQQLLDS